MLTQRSRDRQSTDRNKHTKKHPGGKSSQTDMGVFMGI